MSHFGEVLDLQIKFYLRAQRRPPVPLPTPSEAHGEPDREVNGVIIHLKSGRIRENFTRARRRSEPPGEVCVSGQTLKKQ